MIKDLVVKEFAIIDRLEIALSPGLTCLTGETGAGKSILVDAISVALGGRAGSEALRPDKDTEVQAAFDIKALPALKARLEELGLLDGDELILRRVISPSGRGKAYINGSLANISTLQEVGNFLVDIHGQHEHQSLLKVDRQMDLLDAYCGLAAGLEDYAGRYTSLAALRKRLDSLTSRSRERAQRLDLLRFQIREIDEAAPVPGEEETLASERAQLTHAERLRLLAESSIDALRNSERSAASLLGEAQKAVREIASIVPGEAGTLRLVENALVSVDEASSALRRFAGSLEPDPERLSAIEERLDTLAKLKKKYGSTLEDVLAYRESAGAELDGLEGSEYEVEGLEKEITESAAGLEESATRLSEGRAKGAAGLSRKVEAELSGLGMKKARFEVSFEPLASLGPRGAERAEFLISANPGEPPRPLAKVASGGELSRVMLALKVVLARADSVPTLIFDEVDSGVGGTTATEVGKKLKEASLGRQVLCITHLPQIASVANAHFLVEKTAQGGRTKVAVRRLDKEERVREVARMLGGEGSKTASAHAEELVRRGELHGQA